MNKTTVKAPFAFTKTATPSLKVTSNLKAGGFTPNGAGGPSNHNRKLIIRVSTGLKAGREILQPNHSRNGKATVKAPFGLTKTATPSLKVTSNLKAGGFTPNGAGGPSNHNRKLMIRVSTGLKAGHEILRPNHSRIGKAIGVKSA